MIVKQNSDFLFGFEAVMTNPNGDPDQENKPRMDYETNTLLVSDARRKRDCRDFFKKKDFHIFVDTLADIKVPMDKMFESIRDSWLEKKAEMEKLFNENPLLSEKRKVLFDNNTSNFKEAYHLALTESKKKGSNDEEKKRIKEKERNLKEFNNLLLTEIIKRDLIDIRLFGSAMAVEGVSRTYTGPVQIGWGYSLHPTELVKSNTITSIMNEDSSTFGKKYKVHYALVAHYGTINKYSAALTGMTEEDRELFRKALVQGIAANQTDSKQGQLPLFYLEVMYEPGFDGYLGDLRRFIKVSYDVQKPIRSIEDLNIDFSELVAVIKEMKEKNYVQKLIGWQHPFVTKIDLKKIFDYETKDLWVPLKA